MVHTIYVTKTNLHALVLNWYIIEKHLTELL